MSSSSMGTILTTGTQAIQDYFTTILPILIPVAVGVAAVFFAIHWFFGASRRK